MNFWETKKLAEMTPKEWESICDGCAKCCLNKLEDEQSGEIFFTSVVCELIDLESCRCTQYQKRTVLVPECIDLTQHDFSEYTWLPDTCAYKRLNDGKTLPSWHPLITGNPDSVFNVGASIRSFAIKESQADDLENHIIEWQQL
jgi:uncharacterized cysteine cluster protein YcgN (CxxCxxCC family)